jgi:RNA polymerase sigma-70 factor (ECF subfamily)
MSEDDHREPDQMPRAAAQESPRGLDPQELEALFREHHARMLQAAWRITGTLEDAEDVLQTVFVRLSTRPDRPDLTRSPGAYLHRAAVNAALDIVRARSGGAAEQPVDGVEERLAGGPRDAADRTTQQRELRHRLRTALGALSPKAAEVFVLKHFEGHSNRDIARLLDMSNTSVGVTLHRARQRLQELLGSPEGRSTP